MRTGKQHKLLTWGGVIIGGALFLGFEATPLGSFGTVLQLLGIALIVGTLVWNSISKKRAWKAGCDGTDAKYAEQLKLAYDAYVRDCTAKNKARQAWDQKVERREAILEELSTII